MPLLKILIADDHAMTRKGIELLLKVTFPQCQVVEASNGKEVISKYVEHQPDIVLMDYNMPELNGYDTAQYLLKVHKHIRIVLLTMYDTLPIGLNFLKMGGMGYIWKGGPPEHIIECIRVVANGEYYFSSAFENEMTDWMREGMTQKIPTIKFAPLELNILGKVSQGKTSKKIAEELKLSRRTVEAYRYDLIRKIGAKNTFELINYCFKNGIAIQNP